MADTPWGIAAEYAWQQADAMRKRAEAEPTYDLTCIFCQKLVFGAPDEIARMPGHIYSKDGAIEYGNTRICEWCFDKTADAMDGVPATFFIKMFPQDSLKNWRFQQGKYVSVGTIGEFYDSRVDDPDPFDHVNFDDYEPEFTGYYPPDEYPGAY